MEPELVPVRFAQTMLRNDTRVTDVIEQMRALFGLGFVDAMAAVAASIVLNKGGFTIPDERFARPYV